MGTIVKGKQSADTTCDAELEGSSKLGNNLKRLAGVRILVHGVHGVFSNLKHTLVSKANQFCV